MLHQALGQVVADTGIAEREEGAAREEARRGRVSELECFHVVREYRQVRVLVRAPVVADILVPVARADDATAAH